MRYVQVGQWVRESASGGMDDLSTCVGSSAKSM